MNVEDGYNDLELIVSSEGGHLNPCRLCFNLLFHDSLAALYAMESLCRAFTFISGSTMLKGGCLENRLPIAKLARFYEHKPIVRTCLESLSLNSCSYKCIANINIYT